MRQQVLVAFCTGPPAAPLAATARITQAQVALAHILLPASGRDALYATECIAPAYMLPAVKDDLANMALGEAVFIVYFNMHGPTGCIWSTDKDAWAKERALNGVSESVFAQDSSMPRMAPAVVPEGVEDPWVQIAGSCTSAYRRQTCRACVWLRVCVGARVACACVCRVCVCVCALACVCVGVCACVCA